MEYYPIKRNGSKFELLHYSVWDRIQPPPPTNVVISYNERGFNVHFVSYETNLRAEETVCNAPVCEDSCMEVFFQYDPANDARYINIEINPNGVAYCAVCFNRHQYQLISPEDIKQLDIGTKIFDDRWEIDYRIPKALIRKYIPTYQHKYGSVLRGNFFKCGDKTDHPHYGCFHDIDWGNPDFHRPELFASFRLE